MNFSSAAFTVLDSSLLVFVAPFSPYSFPTLSSRIFVSFSLPPVSYRVGDWSPILRYFCNYNCCYFSLVEFRLLFVCLPNVSLRYADSVGMYSSSVLVYSVAPTPFTAVVEMAPSCSFSAWLNVSGAPDTLGVDRPLANMAYCSC